RPAALTQTSRPWSGKAPIQQMGYSIRTGKHRYTRWVEIASGEVRAEEIYDLERDPYQRRNETENPAFREILASHRVLLDEELDKDR
ncbi:MAG: iduronate sulfatase, partial [Verrucomicrobiota bacterium]